MAFDLAKNLRLIVSAVRQPGLVLLLYGVIAIAFLAPMASTTILPYVGDFIPHLGHIIQAKLALDEGQFPLRVAPLEHNGWRYPVFQFYGQFVHTLGALLYKYAAVNPLVAGLIIIWLALTLAAFFTYLTSLRLVKSQVAAILAGMAYMTAPYFLVNIHGRGAIAEVLAQGILPIVIYFTLLCYTAVKVRYAIAGAVTWFALLGSHTITFIYTTLFLGILILLISIRHLRTQRRQVWDALGCIGLSYGMGLLLSLYYLAPIVHLQSQLVIQKYIGNPYPTRWLTPIATLLQPTSIPPEPQPGSYNLINAAPNIHIAIGWILLGAFITVLYYQIHSWKWPRTLSESRYLVTPLLIIFWLALFMAWSPFDFWQWLPYTLWTTQFPHRIVTLPSGQVPCYVAMPSFCCLDIRLDRHHLVLGILYKICERIPLELIAS